MNHNLQLQLFLLGFLSFFVAALSDYLDPGPCKPQTCGDLQNITYPFWVEQSQSYYCGVPEFKLSCTDDNKAILTLSGDDYFVQKIFYNNQSVVLSNTEYFDWKDCKPRQNFSFSRPFQLNSSNMHIHLFGTCDSSLVGSLGLTPICSDVIAVPEDYRDLTKLEGVCKYSVPAPVWSLDIGEGIDGYLKSLKDGFLLDWNATSMCVDGCVPSGGRCGYDNSRNSPICLCEDRIHFKECKDSSGRI